MAKTTVDDILARLKKLVGEENTSDDVLSLYEDITDTLTYDGEDWEKKYNELDESWRKRYRDRFEHGATPHKEEQDPAPSVNKDEEITIEDLFKEA